MTSIGPTLLASPRPISTRPPFPPPGFVEDIATKAGQRDLTIVFSLITLAIPLFIVSIRLFHPRRRREYAAHDRLVFIAMFFAIMATISFISSLKLGVKPQAIPIKKNSMVAAIASTMNFYFALTLVRISLMLFALLEFGDKSAWQRREAQAVRAGIIVVLVAVSIQGLIATIMTAVACAPVSSAWNPRLFRQDCKRYSLIQLGNACADFFSYSVILTGYVILYVRSGVKRCLLPLKLCILALGILTLFTCAGRASFLAGHLPEIFPPIKFVVPQILEALEMNLTITSAALLGLWRSIRCRSSDDAKRDIELGRKSMNTACWDKMPDLEFKSDEVMTPAQVPSARPLMLDRKVSIDSPAIPEFPQPPSRIVTAASRPRSRSQSPSTLKTLPTMHAAEPRASIPPMPFIANTDSTLETSRQRISSHRSSLSSIGSSILSSGPFSDSEDDDEEEQEEEEFIGRAQAGSPVRSNHDREDASTVGLSDTLSVNAANAIPAEEGFSMERPYDVVKEVPPGTALTR